LIIVYQIPVIQLKGYTLYSATGTKGKWRFASSTLYSAKGTSGDMQAAKLALLLAYFALLLAYLLCEESIFIPCCLHISISFDPFS